MDLDSPATPDHASVLALARHHASQLSDQRAAAISHAKSTLEEKYGLSQLTPEAKMAVEIATTPPLQKLRVQRTEVSAKSSKADARRRARHRRKEGERMKSMVGKEEEVEIDMEDSMKAGIIGARQSGVTDQPEAEVVAVSEALRPTADDMESRSGAATPLKKTHVLEEVGEALLKHMDYVPKHTDDPTVVGMMTRGLEVLKTSRDPTLPARVAPDVYRGASSASKDIVGVSREDQGSDIDVVETEPEQKREVSKSGGSETQIANGAENPEDGLSFWGRPYLYRLHHVEDRVNWENGMLRKLVRDNLGFTEQNIDEWLDMSLWDM